MALVKFVHLDAATYATLNPKDSATLYFVEDSREIYRGSTKYGLQVITGTKPATGVLNTLYIDPNTHEVTYWNGSAYEPLTLPTTTTITEGATDSQIPTAKAVYDYVSSVVTDLDVGELAGRVTTLEGEMDTVQGQITTINGTGEGSINKALEDAKAYTDEQVAGKADKATTLAGYGITDAYTKTEVNSEIQTAVANADHLKREIVEARPEVGAADENTIYMVGDGAGEGEQKYEEFMLINGAFEKIGDSAVDLTGYATETYVDGKIAELDVTDTAVEGNYVTSVSQTDGKITVARQQLPVRSVTESQTNGNISVNGTNVPVHGLGSAAYTDADAYEAAGAAEAAIAALDKTDSAVEGQYVASVSQENGVITVTRKALPQAPAITTGTANGTIAVGGTDVAVKGLGTAAYQNVDAFDAAGDADQALTDAKDYVNGLLSWVEL